MSIAQNLPNLKPSLSLDFANTKKLDPRITFARASTGAYYDGKTVAKAEENLLLRSEEFDNAAWVVNGTTISRTANSTIAPDGNVTADTLAFSGSGELRQVVSGANGTYTFSFYVKGVSGESITFGLAASTGTSNQTLTFDGSWQRASVTQTVTGLLRVWIGTYDTTKPVTISVWGAQLEQRDAVTAYTPTTTQPITNYIPVLQTAPANVARFDHNPVTGESLGLLVEEQRTNLALRSEDFSNAYWTKQNSVINSNAVIAPDGTLTGDLFYPTTSGGLLFNSTLNAPNQTVSLYIKSAGFDWVAIGTNTNDTARAYFNLSSGVVGAKGSTFQSSSIQSVGNGWYRCLFTTGASTSGTGFLAVFAVDGDAPFSCTPSGTKGVYIWGAQLEAGAFPTSYIKTEASQVTRSHDSASMTGQNFTSWWNPENGTLTANFVAGYSLSNACVLRLGLLSSFDNGVDIAIDGNSVRAISWNANTKNADIIGPTATTGQTYQVSVRVKSNDIGASFNGSDVGTDTNCPLGGVDGLWIGQRNQTFTEMLNGHIKRVSYYNQPVTNTNLQALTS